MVDLGSQVRPVEAVAPVVEEVRSRTFVAGIDDLDTLTQLAAAGLAPVDADQGTLSQFIRDRSRTTGPSGRSGGVNTAAVHTAAVDTVVTAVGTARRVSPSVAQVALELADLAEQTAVARPGAAELHVAVIHQATGLRLLVHDAHGALPTLAAGAASAADSRSINVPTWQELVDTHGGGVTVDQVPGWGMSLRADLPYADAEDQPASSPSPFTGGEQQLLRLLAEGAGDRIIAWDLVISQRTVEKHVGAILRKTGAPSRTAAVVRALDHRWLTDPGRPTAS